MVMIRTLNREGVSQAHYLCANDARCEGEAGFEYNYDSRAPPCNSERRGNETGGYICRWHIGLSFEKAGCSDTVSTLLTKVTPSPHPESVIAFYTQWQGISVDQ